MPVLSLIMPVYNEGDTLQQILQDLGKVDMPCSWELIICDDGSSDGAVDSIDSYAPSSAESTTIVRSRRNRGKGSALRRGFALAKGDILGVQDADLEYDPHQIPALVAPILDGDADVVFGSREFGAHAAYSYWYVLGNRMMSTAASALFNRYITDAYTCYKFFTRDAYEGLSLTADGFEIEAELAGGLMRAGWRIYELPINYRARSRADGKKIQPKDGFRGISRLVRVRVLGR